MLKYFSLQSWWEVEPGQDITSQLSMIAIIWPSSTNHRTNKAVFNVEGPEGRAYFLIRTTVSAG